MRDAERSYLSPYEHFCQRIDKRSSTALPRGRTLPYRLTAADLTYARPSPYDLRGEMSAAVLISSLP